MKKVLGILFFFAILFTGCTYKTAVIKYNKFNAYSQNLGGNIQYKEIAPVKSCASDFIWKDCSEVSEEALKRLQEQAKVLGGNGLVNVTWYSDESNVLTPTCKIQWGWFLLYILPGLGPWVQSACVQGVAVKFIDNTK